MEAQEILTMAVDALNRHIYPDKAEVEHADEAIYLKVMDRRFVCIIESNLTLAKMSDRIQYAYNQKDSSCNCLFITENVTPKMLDVAKGLDISVLDCAGNFNIRYREADNHTLLWLSNKGEKPIVNKVGKAYPIFGEKGLKIIFYLLLDKRNVNQPYREIVEATGVAIGTVKNIIDGMIYHDFVRVEGRKRFLVNIDRLLALWSANYDLTLKPKLLLAKFAFRNQNGLNEWEQMVLPKDMVWGGEPAASLTDGFITPGYFTIYTDVPAAMLMKTGMVLPDQFGNIAVYKKFWKDEIPSNTTPALLTYADLINTANGRCIEAAQKLKENELKYLF